jgi:hypothetical protein
MSAEKIIKALLYASSELTALVADRIYPLPAPQDCVFPAVGYRHISTTPQPTIDASAPYNLVSSRVEVAVMAQDYPTQKSLIGPVRRACEFQRGTIAGVPVVAVLWDADGVDFRDDAQQLYVQTVDFMITFREPI